MDDKRFFGQYFEAAAIPGSFQGMRMLFQVMLRMVIGPQIGSWVISQFGVPSVMNGEAGFIPTYHIFIATALVNILALIPILITRKKKT